MQFRNLRVNHIENPLGYAQGSPVFSWTAESSGKKQRCARVRVSADAEMKSILFDTGEAELSSLGVPSTLKPAPRTRYYWQVEAAADDGDVGQSEIAWFETGKMDELWAGKWIAAPFPEHPVFRRRVAVSAPVRRARLYITGLGLYEASLNGEKIGDEFLTPGFSSYQFHMQVHTFDVTELLREGENELSVLLGKGWYMGRFGFGQEMDCIYGDRMQLLCELRIEYADGREDVIGSDESWQCAPSVYLESGILDGEHLDMRITPVWRGAEACPAPEGKPDDRLALPVRIGQVFAEYTLIRTPRGELVLDFGQNMAGFARFVCTLPEGRKVELLYGELLQDECFYQGNLRTAKAAFSYISDGKTRAVAPRFTYYGFRYVCVKGMTEEEIEKAQFTACALWSALDGIGRIETSDAKLNKLFSNALWSQRGNFVDIPTDCPQRDERMGWTGDAQAFSETACYNLYTPAFYRRFLSDMHLEQSALSGSVPYVVPDVLTRRRFLRGADDMYFTDKCDGSCAWGDAAAIIPWNLYRFYGDKSLLAENYAGMKDWVEYIRRVDRTECGNTHIWNVGFHFADWLALDNAGNSDNRLGSTDNAYVATCYYYLSASLTAKAARILGREDDAREYETVSEEVKEAFQKTFIAQDGSLACRTQTAYVLALHLGLFPEEFKKQGASTLRQLFRENGDLLTTGFVGTYLLCPTLSENGMSELAWHLLLNEEYPGWLHEINLGATTVWERWNSVLPDGHVSDTGMNSMNHYAFGSVIQWVYQYAAGLACREDAPGFKKVRIAPKVTDRLSFLDCSYDSAAGKYAVRWEKAGEKTRFTVTVPFDCEAQFILPDGGSRALDAGTYVIEA